MRTTSTSTRSLGGLALSAVALAALSGSWSVAVAQTTGDDDFAPGRIIIQTKPGLPAKALDRMLKDNGATKSTRIGRTQMRVIELPRGQEKNLVRRLSRNKHVEFAELDRRVQLGSSNDPFFGSQWHLSATGTPTAWAISAGSGVTIAILDTGVDGSHPDLKDRMVAGYNFFDGNTDTRDVRGHGTAVAGTAAASLNNAVGVAAPAGQARIMPLRVSALDGSAFYSTIANAVTWAADNGAKVANVSYQKACGSATLQSAAQYMRGKGGIVVASAGNSGVQEAFTASDNLLCVSATGGSGVRTSWSSFGGYVDIAAPGENIYTTTSGGGYGAWNGTSFSSPLTAGIVAMMMGANPRLAPADLERMLFATATDAGSTGKDVEYGWGRINAAAAVQAAADASTPTTDTQKPTSAISSPGASSTVSGLTTVDVAATDNVGVTKVEFLVNGNRVATDTAAPFSFSWDSTTVANGAVTLSAVAYDAAGNSTTSSGVSVNVSNATATIDTTAPAVAISSPGASSTVGGTVSISAAATDNVGVAKVEFYVNGGLLATDTTAPYAASWDTTRLANGGATLTAVAFDAAGNRTTSSAVGVSVANTTSVTPTGDGIAPTVSLVNPKNGSTVSGNVGVEVSASDNSGTSGMSITLRINGTTVATSTNSGRLKFGWQTRNAPKGANLVEAIARDAAGNSTTTSVTVYR